MTNALAETLRASSVERHLARHLAEAAADQKASERRRTVLPVASSGGRHVGADGGAPDWWRRSGYIEQVAELVPAGGLLDRGEELAELAEFCHGDEAFLWWQARPWAGKSALMATFVRNPPPRVDVVSFFVTARLAGYADSNALIDVLIDQLSAIIGQPLPRTSAFAMRDMHRRSVIRDAVRQVQDSGRELVMVLDGLDEDVRGRPGSGLASVASVLPRLLGGRARVIVSSRPDPPLPQDVLDSHPLRRCRIRQLAVSPHATDVAELAWQELTDLLFRGRAERDIIGFLAVRKGGLTLVELEQLTGIAPFRLEHILTGNLGRTVVARVDHGVSPPQRLYVFIHEALVKVAREQLGTHMARYRRRLERWAQTHVRSDGVNGF
ncbi:hypothetical protein [Dactylosporangium sp. NPDC051541]|uniref:hypothetical protein n=1 Tax=Dactylosporangium sp. NPDC051541 TaxID=3363977 RepID=UPI0037AE470E